MLDPALLAPTLSLPQPLLASPASPTCQPLWRHLEPRFSSGGTSVACSESLGAGGRDSVGPSIMAGKTSRF